jgi:hypothetical protein
VFLHDYAPGTTTELYRLADLSSAILDETGEFIHAMPYRAGSGQGQTDLPKVLNYERRPGGSSTPLSARTGPFIGSGLVPVCAPGSARSAGAGPRHIRQAAARFGSPRARSLPTRANPAGEIIGNGFELVSAGKERPQAGVNARIVFHQPRKFPLDP